GEAESGGGRIDLAALAAEGRALNSDRRIDRGRVWKLKRTALEHLWVRFTASGGDPAFDAFCAEQGDALTGFATHCVLAERFPGAWVDWPEEYRRPHPTTSTARGRTGAFPRSTPGGCAWPAMTPGSARCGRASGPPEASGSTM